MCSLRITMRDFVKILNHAWNKFNRTIVYDFLKKDLYNKEKSIVHDFFKKIILIITEVAEQIRQNIHAWFYQKIIYKIKKVAVKIGQNIHAGFHQKIISINIKVMEGIQQNDHAWFYQKIILIIKKSRGTNPTKYSCMILSKKNLDNREK